MALQTIGQILTEQEHPQNPKDQKSAASQAHGKTSSEKKQPEEQPEAEKRLDANYFANWLRQHNRRTRRFVVDKYVKDIPALLLESYRYEVETRGYSFYNDQPTQEHVATAAKWLVGEIKMPGLFLYGEPGNGKTTLAKAITTLINSLYDSSVYSERRGVRYIHASQLVEAARGEKTGLLNELKNTDLLYIDDVGTEQASVKVWGNEVSPLVDLLYFRYDRQLFTIITSNLTNDEDIIERYGNRINDRFAEMFHFLGFDNGTYRPRLKTL